MKQIIRSIVIATCIIATTSCNDWLDVTPQGDAEAEDLLSTQSGLSSALAGIYHNLLQGDNDSKTGIHAKDMSYGALDVMAQYYDVSNLNHEDHELAKYDYKNASVEARINKWWKVYYEGIGQSNQILEFLESNRAKFETSNLFEGELLGLRAFMHLQLYQLFGPVVQSDADLDQKAIPYRTKFDNVASSFLSCRGVLSNIKGDLLKALELLKNDPIKKGHKRFNFNESLLSYNDILDNRVGRINYFAVIGLLSRVEQLLLNQSEADGAFYWADRLLTEIDNDRSAIYLSTQEEVANSSANSRDLLYSSEIIFSLHNHKLFEETGSRFVLPGSKSDSRGQVFIRAEAFDNLVNFVYGREPDGSGSDYRLIYWFDQNSGSKFFPFQKYRKPRDPGFIYKVSYPEIAILRLSEIYYTLCEAKIGVDNVKALEYLNAVRVKRGLPELAVDEADNVAVYLMRERRKEFMGDGRIFLICKRLFKNIEVSSALTVQASKEMYELPIPENEYTYGPEDKVDNN